MLKLNEIKFYEKLYPRNGFDNEVVNNYRLNLDSLPPILVQKEEKILIDGYHRLIAHRVEGKKEIEVKFLDIPKKRILWEATKRNASHGLQLKRDEKHKLAKEFYQQGIKQKDIAQVLAVSEAILSDKWLKELIKDAKKEQERQIINFYLRCLTQEEIANEIGLTQERISQIINKFKTKFTYNPPESLQLFNVWNFAKRDERYGLEGAPGQIPGQIIENVLYYFTEPFDTVVDPMAGGGTTIDVCKAMYRRYKAYDINPLRDDIKKWDITKGFPKETKNCDLIFLDPPYYKKLKDKLGEDSVSSLAKKDFLVFVENLAKDCFKTVKEKGVIALLASDYLDYEKGADSVLSFEYASFFKKAGFSPLNHISTPLGTEQWSGSNVQKAKEKKILLEIARDLYIFEKVK